MLDEETLHTALQEFAQSVTRKASQLTAGEPEEQLRGPFEAFMKKVGEGLSLNVVCTGETKLPGRIGKPDYAVHARRMLAGYAELKAPGTGADTSRFTGHSKRQWERFKSIPNILYTDGNEWGLYRNGQRIGAIIRLSGDAGTDGRAAARIQDARDILPVLQDFLSWKPIIPKEVPQLAELLAPLCRFLRDDVTEALADQDSPLIELARDWRQLLFPGAGNEQFADAYAQTVTFALLLARSEGAAPLTLDNAVNALAADHTLLSRALLILTDQQAQREISASLNMLVRVIAEVTPSSLSTGAADPWIYFYEHFLAAYDPKLRKDTGAYYTPLQVVHAQVRLIDDLLQNKLGKTLGFADKEVVTLDPAVGTGTYLLGVIDHALRDVEAQQGPGAVPGQATALAHNIYGFEIMVGPCAVSELRVSRALQDKGANLPQGGIHIYLTDTLESPHTTPPQLPQFLEPIADQHRKALQIKETVPVIVCLGNPPYDRHEAAHESNKARTGGWVRWGDENEDTVPILSAFIRPAETAGHGVHLKNLYNLYVYFWRWAFWKVFEHKTASGAGIVSFITASSYLDGDAFVGMREHMRRMCDQIWIIDLGGEGRGTRRDENVFAIQTPVAIAVAFGRGKTGKQEPAAVHFTRVEGTENEKLHKLDRIHTFADLPWEDCPSDWQAPFRPAGKGAYFQWPALTDLFPWQHSGVQLKRTWPIAPDQRTLKRRWAELLHSEDRAQLFRETCDRQVTQSYSVEIVPGRTDSTPIAKLQPGAPPPPIVRYAYRSFDRQYLCADGRLISRQRPPLWVARSEKQVHLTSLLTKPLGSGPALTSCAEIPDLDHFSGRGAKDVIPLYRDQAARVPNILPKLFDMLRDHLSRKLTPEDFLAYVYGILAQPGFTRRFKDDLATKEIRVPITKSPELFEQVRDVGRQLLWLHTYGERFIPQGHHRGHIPRGNARCTRPVSSDPEGYPKGFDFDSNSQILRVGDGHFSPVSEDVYEFEVSGLKVAQSWLKYRMKNGAGRKSSSLDDIRPERWTNEFTTELLELIWVLEATLAVYPQQEELLQAVINGPIFAADELPAVPDRARRAPSGTAPLFDDSP
ncbi:MAG: N-6 DNA methylase [Planctomycetes bacterium]|nr:N-6 DNA methylase [Planctomycetota bacterium]